MASDMAWLYSVDPDAKFGPPAPAWSDLQSISCERHLAGSSVEDLVDELDSRMLTHNSIARREGRPTIDPPFGPALPHSVLANRGNEIHALVITGSLWDIAMTLTASGFEHAMLLDQSGSLIVSPVSRNALRGGTLRQTTRRSATSSRF